jgi:hypothetical protein
MLRSKRVWKRNKTIENWQAFKVQRNLYFKVIRKAKESSWLTYLTEAQGQDAYKALQYLKPRRIQQTPCLSYEDNIATSFTEKTQLFRKVLFPPPPEIEVLDERDTPRRI